MRRRIIVFPLLFVLLGVSSGLAEDRRVVFIHGLTSSSETWEEAASRLTQRLQIEPYLANLNWRAIYESQATELEQRLGGQLPSNVVAVGHSNGGVIARQWSRTRDVGSLITLGSPNQGAPVVDHLFEWYSYLDDILNRVANVSNAFSLVNRDVWWWLPAQWTARFAFAYDLWNTAGNGLFSLGFDFAVPVMAEMRVGSAYMANLNAVSSRDSEAGRVVNRVAIVNAARDFVEGGPFRIVAPDQYGAWHVGINVTGIALEGLAGIIRITADVYDQPAYDLADQLSVAAEWFLQFEDVWCLTVSDPSPYPVGRCFEHDGVVPLWSQAYDQPRLPLIIKRDGPIHSTETRNSDDELFQALTTVARVEVRTSAPPPSGGSSPPDPTLNPPPSDPPSEESPTPPPPTGRYKVTNGGCVWDPNDSGPDQCSPSPPPGRYKLDGAGSCYWEPNDYPPDQCAPPPPVTGRYKVGDGGCYWDPNDGGPDQCAP